MSEALYRKYRPQTFDDVVGQTHIERTLKNAIESDKVSHAYLFCGPRGTGKTTTARLLAKALLCEEGPTPSPDGTCEQCRAIADGTHPDVNEMDAASRTGVENVREEIIGRVQYAPTRGRYKIYIIDEVHMLSTAAFNALLKTLEEPPDHVVFILCTTDSQKVPETILSRCQRFDFHRLSTEQIVARLGAVCVSEDVQFEGDALELIAHRAQGGMRDALTTLEQLIAFGDGKVTMDVARNVLGSLDTDDMTTIVDSIATRDAAACFTWVSEYIETGADLAQFARDLAGYVRDLYVLELTHGESDVNVPASSREVMISQAKKFGPDRLAYILGILGDLTAELRTSTNARLSFEIALTRMVRPESDLTLESLAARVETLEAAVASGLSTGGLSAGAGENTVCAPTVSVPPNAMNAVTEPAAAMSEEGTKGKHSQALQGLRQPNSPQATPSASIPRASSGYKPITRNESPSTQSAADTAAAAMSKAASLRAQLEQHKQGSSNSRSQEHSASQENSRSQEHSASQENLRSQENPAFQENLRSQERPVAPMNPRSQNKSTTGVTVDDTMRAKLLNPASLQRGWKAALSELKRDRTVYAALMQSARIVADADGSGIALEFSKGNKFAYSAAQKPEVVEALKVALENAFGGIVPFRFTQGEGIVAEVRGAEAGRGVEDVRGIEDTESPAPIHHGAEASSMQSSNFRNVASTTNGVSAENISSSSNESSNTSLDASTSNNDVPNSSSEFSNTSLDASRPNNDVPRPNDEAFNTSDEFSNASGDAFSSSDALSSNNDLSVRGPAPVDPYPMGQKLGFDSMPAPQSRSKGIVLAKGWPGLDESSAGKEDTFNEIPDSVSADTFSESRNSVGADTFDGNLDRIDPNTFNDANNTAKDAMQDDAVNITHGNSFNTVDEISAARKPFTEASFEPDGADDFSTSNSAVGREALQDPGLTAQDEAGNKDSFTTPEESSSAESMEIEDIFGAFGVSMEDVQEED